jgi:hypothetical protein|tara:strand:+ start:3323 stop:3562 length:240 start_codon:yes stop_codon:yes gene_type:complete
MKKMDERNLRLLNEATVIGEYFSARQALEKLMNILITKKQSTKYVPHANRLSHILRLSNHYKVHEKNATRSHTMYERIN